MARNGQHRVRRKIVLNMDGLIDEEQMGYAAKTEFENYL